MSDEKYPSVNHQRSMWANCVSNKHLYSMSWGNPQSAHAVNSSGQRLGNYQYILHEILIPNIEGKVVLDLGCFDGKWTQYMSSASKIICVDLDRTGFDSMAKWFDHPNIDFYRTDGDELKGVSRNSVDFIFCMDSLVRSEREIISKYISEFKRILTITGKMCVHLPAQDQPLSHELGFTQIDSEEIMRMCDECGLDGVSIEKDIVSHGILLLR